MARLNSSTRKAAQTVAIKLAGGSSGQGQATSITTPTIPQAATVNVSDSGISSIKIDGLPELIPANVVGLTPKFDHTAYQIADPLNPSTSIPQATQAQYDAGMATYEGAGRALKLTGAALDVTREKFATIGKFAKAVGSGIRAASDLERTKADLLDYSCVLETTQQKGIALGIGQTKTASDRAIAGYTKQELAEKIALASIRAEKATLDTQQKQGELNAFRQQLGNYFPIANG